MEGTSWNSCPRFSTHIPYSHSQQFVGKQGCLELGNPYSVKVPGDTQLRTHSPLFFLKYHVIFFMFTCSMLGQRVRVRHSKHIEGGHKLRELLSTFYCMAPGIETQVIRASTLPTKPFDWPRIQSVKTDMVHYLVACFLICRIKVWMDL